MVKIHTDFRALRRDGSLPKPRQESAPSAHPVPDVQDQAVISEAQRSVAEANVAASRRRVQDLQQARAVAQALRVAISNLNVEAFASHEGLSADRIQSLLQ